MQSNYCLESFRFMYGCELYDLIKMISFVEREKEFLVKFVKMYKMYEQGVTIAQ